MAETKHRIFTTSVASAYPHYVAKAERKGRTRADVDEILRWLTGVLLQLRLRLKDVSSCLGGLKSSTDRSTGCRSSVPVEGDNIIDGYIARKGNRWYAVIYHGLDPVTGREQRTWHAAGTDEAAAERLARKLAKQVNGRDDADRGLTFGAYLTQRGSPPNRSNSPRQRSIATDARPNATSCRPSVR